MFYEIEVDGEVVFSGTTTVGQAPVEFELGLAGATDLKLRGTQTARTGWGISIAFLDGSSPQPRRYREVEIFSQFDEK